MRNDETTGMVMAICVILAVLYFIAAAVFALVAFACVIFTGLALAAWIKPFTLFGEELTREDGRAFIGRGILGAVMCLAFAEFCKALFGLTLPDQVYGIVTITGYAFGAIGVGYAIEEERNKAQVEAEAQRPKQEILPPPPHYVPPPHTYASWYDEDEVR